MAKVSTNSCCSNSCEHGAVHEANFFQSLDSSNTDIFVSSLGEAIQKLLMLHCESFIDELRRQFVNHSTISKQPLIERVSTTDSIGGIPQPPCSELVQPDQSWDLSAPPKGQLVTSMEAPFQRKALEPGCDLGKVRDADGPFQSSEVLEAIRVDEELQPPSQYHQLQQVAGDAVVSTDACMASASNSKSAAVTSCVRQDGGLASASYFYETDSCNIAPGHLVPPGPHSVPMAASSTCNCGDGSPCSRDVGNNSVTCDLTTTSQNEQMEEVNAKDTSEAQPVEAKQLSQVIHSQRPLVANATSDGKSILLAGIFPSRPSKSRGSSSDGSSRSRDARGLEFDNVSRYINEHLHQQYFSSVQADSRRSSVSTNRSISEEGSGVFSHRTSMTLKDLRLQRATNDIFRFETATTRSDDQVIAFMFIFGSESKINAITAVFLQCFGVLPWWHESSNEPRRICSACYRWCLSSFSVSSIIGFAVRGFVLFISPPPGATQNQHIGALCDLCMAAGSLLGFLSMGALQTTLPLADCFLHLRRYAHIERQKIWTTGLAFDLFLTWLCLSFAMLARVMGDSSECRGAVGIMFFVAYAFHYGMILALTLAMHILCRAFHTLVTTFCFDVDMKRDLTESVRTWNLLQSMMRTATITIEKCFLIIQTIAVFVVVGNIISIASTPRATDKSIPALHSALFLAAPVIRTFFWTGSVTDLCSRVPSLVNCIFFGRNVDPRRQCVVEYISRCAAGFYVFEVPVTRSMFLKLAYFVAVFAVTVVPRAAFRITSETSS